MKINYDEQLEKIIKGLNGQKEKLLLHCCCAPCATVCIERLKDFFDLTCYFYNPNMDDFGEYVMRSNELKRLCNELKVDYIIADYDNEKFIQMAKGKENEPERGVRCFDCYNLRLDNTCKKAKEDGFDFFATTLTLSPLKDAHKLNEIGYNLEKEFGVKYLPSDFKKKGGYLRSIEMSKEYDLYRQNYCGCIYSKR